MLKKDFNVLLSSIEVSIIIECFFYYQFSTDFINFKWQRLQKDVYTNCLSNRESWCLIFEVEVEVCPEMIQTYFMRALVCSKQVFLQLRNMFLEGVAVTEIFVPF